MEELFVMVDGVMKRYYPPKKPRWYVVNIGEIVCTCDTEEEANRIADELDLEVYPEEARIVYDKRGNVVPPEKIKYGKKV